MATPAPRRAAALLVGIGAYRHADRIAPLRYAPRDARALARLAGDPEVCGMASEDVCLLRDERAGRREIVRRLSRWLPERSAGADLALVYFAGHGVVERVGGREEGYLVPHDADPDDISGQGISMADVARWLDRVQARAVVLCLDCCHAGSILPGDGVSLRGERDLSLNPSLLAQLGGKGRFLIASCDRGQKSIESDDLRHGLFTYHLLRGLEGEADRDGDGAVSAAELFRYVSEAVQRDARERFGREQTPWTSATYSEDVPLSTVRRTVPASTTSDEDAPLVEQLRLLRRKPDPERVALLFSCLAHKGDGVRQRARQALHALGWDRAAELALDQAARDAGPLLDGLAALEASERVAALLGRLVEKLRGPARDRAVRLHDRKRLSLDMERVAAVFREEKRPYELVRVLGPGLYTGAYLARMGSGGHEVVVRVLRPEFAMQPMVRGQFLEAGGKAVPLVHQNLVLTRHAEEIAGRGVCYTVRDYIAGATLRDVLESGRRFDRAQAVRLLRQVAKGLTPLHRAGMAHNGVKPSNIFLADDGRVVLGDPSLPLPPMGWDMLRLAYDFRYASPDLLAGKLSPASDFYSLGCVAHELLLGCPPKVADTPYELIARLGREPIDLTRLDDLDRPWLSRLLGAPAFGSLDELLQALRDEPPAATLPQITTLHRAPSAPAAPPRPVMAGDVGSPEALLPPESLADAAGMQSVVPFTRADGGGVSHFGGETSAPGDFSAGHGPSSPPGYEILSLLGRGGMGVVYKARQVSLDRVVALKMILGGGHASEQSRARFRAEAQAVARLHHPAILAVHDFGEHEGNAFLAMEFCAGGTLSERLRGEGLPQEAAARLAAILARGLHHAHDRGIVHRDVKPANVLFAEGGEPKLTDFGLARLMADDGPATLSGAILGTPAYMAPEQARGDSKGAGPAADIYSLGALLYHALTGRPPYQGGNLHEMMLKVMEGRPEAPSRVRPGIDRALEAICLRCLARDPAARWESAAALAEALQGCFRAEDRAAPMPMRARMAPGAAAPQGKRWWWPF